jgi:hypothetical protein
LAAVSKVPAYLAQALTRALGPPERTPSGQNVWNGYIADEPVIVTISKDAGGDPALRIMQAAEGAHVEYRDFRVISTPTRVAADAAVAQVTRTPT